MSQEKIQENITVNEETNVLILEQTQSKKEKENSQQKITTPIAIIVAGFLIMIGILITNGGGKSTQEKTLSEQVGVSKNKLATCLKETDLQELRDKTNVSAENAMKGLPPEQRGTPYSIIVGDNGIKTEIRGAYPKEEINKLIEEVLSGKVTNAYAGEVPAINENDHILGNVNAPIKIIEYSDLECPYCKRFGDTMKEIVAESDGKVAWVYRHWIIHPGALSKTGAAECVAQLKGNDAFWKYIDLIFGLMKTEEETFDIDKL